MKPRIVVAFLLLVLCISASGADRKFIVKPRASDMKALPFSDAVMVGNTLYIAGHIGLDAKTGAPPANAVVTVNRSGRAVAPPSVVDVALQLTRLPDSPSPKPIKSRKIAGGRQRT